MKKRAIALLLTTAMMAGLLPASVFAAEGESRLGFNSKTGKNEADKTEVMKSAYWVDQAVGTAEIELNVKGVPSETEEVKGANVLLLLDTSGSMKWDSSKTPCGGEHTPKAGGSFGAAGTYVCSTTEEETALADPAEHLLYGYGTMRSFASKFVDKLSKSGGKFPIMPITFDDRASTLGTGANQYISTYFSTNAEVVKNNLKRIDSSWVQGDTYYDAGLAKAAEYVQHAANSNYDSDGTLPTKIIFLSDGMPTHNHEGVGTAQEILTKKTGNEVVEIFTIAFNIANVESGNVAAAEQALKAISSQPADEYYFSANGADALDSVFNSIASKITNVVPAGRETKVTDTIADPFEIDMDRWTDKPDNITVENQTVTWDLGSTNEAGSTLLIPVKLKADKLGQTINATNTNDGQAVVSYKNAKGQASSLRVDSPVLSRQGDEPELTHKLSATKLAEPQLLDGRKTIREGDTIKYTVEVQNEGTAIETKVVLSDTMFGSAVRDIKIDGKPAQLNQDNTLSLGDIKPGGVVTVTYAYTVAEADENQSIKNAASAKSAEGTETDTSADTAKVEGKQELKIYYAVEEVQGNITQFVTQNQDPYVVLKGYPGDTVSRAAVEKAIADQLGAPAAEIDVAARDIAGLNGEFTFGESSTTLIVKDSLVRYTLTYQPNGGTLALGEGAKGEAKNGNIVFTVPHGAVPATWFGTEKNGMLAITASHGSKAFNGWDGELAMNQPIKENVAFAAQWRDSSAVAYKVEFFFTGSEQPFDTRTDFTLTPSGDSFTLALDADVLIAQEQSRGLPQGYKFARYNDDITAKSHTFALAGQDNTVRVYFAPYDLSVWHVYGSTKLFDEAQSKAVLSEAVQTKANAAVFNNSRIIYGSTAVAIDGAADTAKQYTDMVEVPAAGNSYEIVFNYRTRSSGGGTTPDKEIDITEPDVPLAPGLDGDDHFAYVIGYPDGNIRPEANIDRQEVATIFFRLLTEESRTEAWSQTSGFGDMSSKSWSNNAVSTMTNAGILKGYEDGKFHPQAYITRAEFAAIAARFDSAQYVGEDKFSDIGGHWAASYINRAAQMGWVKGYEDGRFRPDAYITRAEAMTLVNSVLNRRVKAEGLSADMKQWPDCSAADWFYTAVQEATNSHDYDRPTFLDFETWTGIKPARDWKALEAEWSEAN